MWLLVRAMGWVSRVARIGLLYPRIIYTYTRVVDLAARVAFLPTRMASLYPRIDDLVTRVTLYHPKKSLHILH
ncbi:hypothetical protein GCM10022259_12660 [Aquimarina mytili]